jgi:peptidoglycan/xylan/chitin deacetylase (PgdA/CDA1 family)
MAAPAKIKLVQCWDDGVVDDIRLTEILRKHRATASFNLNLGQHRPERYFGGHKFKDTKEVFKLALPELKDVYEGFTVANHTLTHPHLTQISLDEARREIEEGRDALEQLFGYRIEGFAYPFGDHNAEVRELVRAARHLYARPVASTRCVFPPADPMDFRPSCHFLAQNFWEEFEAARLAQNVFYFWGHSYEIMTESDWRDFDEKIERLSVEGEWVSLPSLFSNA